MGAVFIKEATQFTSATRQAAGTEHIPEPARFVISTWDCLDFKDVISLIQQGEGT